MQQMLIIKDNKDNKYKYPVSRYATVTNTDTDTIDELNDYLSDGWKVVNMQAVSSGDGAVCYVLIENKSVH